MKKNILRILLLLIIITVIGSIFLTYIGQGNVFADDTIIDPDSYDPGLTTEDATPITKKAGVIFNIIQVIGIVVAVITLMIIGIKYMAGSVEEKANYKQVLLPWMLGAVLVVTGTSIPNVIYKITSATIGTTSSRTNEDKSYEEEQKYQGELIKGSTSKTVYINDTIVINTEVTSKCTIPDCLELISGDNTNGDTTFTFRAIKVASGKTIMFTGLRGNTTPTPITVTVKEKEKIIDTNKTKTSIKLGENIIVYTTTSEYASYEINGQKRGKKYDDRIEYKPSEAGSYTVTIFKGDGKDRNNHDSIRITVVK